MSSTIKVAIDATVVPAELTGAGYYITEIIKKLGTSAEIELTIITKKSDKGRFLNLAPNSHVLNVAPDSLPKRLLFQTFKLGKLVDSLNVDVFHGTHYQVPKNMTTPSAVTIHDMTLLTHREVHKKTKTLYFSKVIPKAINTASSIIAVSNSTSDDIKKYFDTKTNIFVAQLGYNKDRFNTTEDNDLELLSNRGIDGDYIGFLGLLEPRKCVPNLVNAFAKIHQDFPNLKLVLAGAEGWGIPAIREAIKESNCSTKIILPGRLTDNEVGAFYRQTKCFVYPSMYEGFGMPVLEAMACGAPVITTESSSLSEVAGNAGILVSPNDIEAIANALTKVLSDDDCRNSLVHGSLEQANKFSWESCAEVHIEAYQAALRQK